MNVYFCDVCGVRVTDTDLHSGHGMRRRNDVICAACLELGHGKGLFAQDGQKQLVMAGGEAAASSNGKHPSPSATATATATAPPAGARLSAPDALGEARDRSRTLDDDQPPSTVRPITVLSAPPAGLEADGDAEAETAPPPEMTPEFEDTAKVPVVHQELASAAAGFAALNPPAAKASDTGTQDVVEVPPSKLDDSGGAAVIAQDADDPEKAETAIGARVDPDIGAARSAQSTGRRATSSTSSKSSKQVKSRNLRKSGKKGNQQALIVLSAMGTLVLIIFGFILFRGLDAPSKKGGERISVNVEEGLKQAISDAKAAVTIAQSSQTADAANHAILLINAVRDQATKFETIAKNANWTEEQIDDHLTSDGMQQVMTMRKLCEDILVKAHENATP